MVSINIYASGQHELDCLIMHRMYMQLAMPCICFTLCIAKPRLGLCAKLCIVVWVLCCSIIVWRLHKFKLIRPVYRPLWWNEVQGTMKPYGDMYICQYCCRQWLFACWHQAISESVSAGTKSYLNQCRIIVKCIRWENLELGLSRKLNIFIWNKNIFETIVYNYRPFQSTWLC